MLSFEEFKKAILDMIRSYLPLDNMGADISIQEVTRNNDQKGTALHIKEAEDRIVPNIYLEDYYKMYQQKEDLDEILISIANTYEQSHKMSDKLLPFDPKVFENVKDRLYVAIMNENLNTDYLDNKIHKNVPGTDLSAVVRVICSKEERSSFAVSEEMIDTWGVSEDELYKLALENSERIMPVTLKNMQDIMMEFAMGPLGHVLEEDERVGCWKLEPHEQYVLSNEERSGGASALLYEGVLKKIAEETEGNFFILPSSLHEVILMKDTGELSAEELQNMVMSINRSQVRPEDVLSDEVYYYDAKEQKLTMATDPEQTKIYQEQMGGYREYDSEDEFLQGEEDDEGWER